VIALTTGNRLKKLVTTRLGRVDPNSQPWPVSLEALATHQEARWAVQLHSGALEELMDRLGERLRPEHDTTEQALELYAVVRELQAEGALITWPWRLTHLPVIGKRSVQRVFDALCPEGKSIVLGAFEHAELATCLAARRNGLGFDRILGPGSLRLEMGLLSGDWTRDYRYVLQAARSQLGTVGLGCFANVDTYRRLHAHASPGAWAAAVASRDVILSPVVPAVAIPLGIDAGRAALLGTRQLAERLGISAGLDQLRMLPLLRKLLSHKR
jgi:hypothetical protein